MNLPTDKKPSILAVDDNAYTLRIVQFTLKGGGYDVVTAMTGEEALESIANKGMPDLAVVDLHMPGGISGFELCHAVHQFSDLPIIMLTAVGDEDTVLEGLEKHAEDYIVKPFSSGELVARVNRILQRMGQWEFPSTPLTFVDDVLKIDFPNRKAIVNGNSISLTPTETKLLYILMRNAGKVVQTDFILRRLWPGEPAFEDRLHVHLHRLRRKLESDQAEPTHEYIASERGKGYLFVSQPVEQQSENTQL
jgi:DNA-binding response OmpR family regulator